MFKDNIYMCGFPKNAISKIMAQLETKKINYIAVDTRNNYDVEYKQDNKNLNQYENILKKSYNYVSMRKRIMEIEQILLDNIEKEEIVYKIKKIEDIIYERRKGYNSQPIKEE